MLDDISRLATCKICQIASSLRVCGECKFRNAWTGLEAVVLEVPPDFRSVSEPGTAEEAASAMLIGAPTWEFPWSDEEVASEEMNQRPEVSL